MIELRSEEGILSAYIKVDPRLMYQPGYPEVELKSALKAAESRIKQPKWKEAFKRERQRVLEFISEWKPSGRGLAIFTCSPARIWEVVHLNVVIPSFVDIDVKPNTELLARIVDEFAPLAVAVIQRDRASIYFMAEQSAEETAHVESEVPGKHDQGGWSQPRYQRHIEVHVDEHLSRVAEELKRLQAERSFSSLALGGTEETAGSLLKLLPAPLSQKVIGIFPVDAKHDSEDEILERARSLWSEKRRDEQQALVSNVIDASKAGGSGTLGPRQTMDALLQEKVRTLLLPDGAEIRGTACVNCAYLGTEESDRCPLCGGELESGNITGRLVGKALATGARIESLHGPASEKLIEEGGIGALLRYA